MLVSFTRCTHLRRQSSAATRNRTGCIDREKLAGRLPPRVPAHESWRVDEAWLEEAQDDATRLAVRDMEEAGIDVVTDGEIRRESYSNYFANALEGLDLDEPGTALDRTGHPNPVPRVVGEIRRARPVQVRDAEFLRALTDRQIRVTVPGPFTMSQQAQNDHYPSLRELALAYAEAVNEELAGPGRGRRGRRPDRRALPAGAARRRARVRARGHRPSLQGSMAGRRRCIRASAMQRSSTRSRATAIRSSPSSMPVPQTRSRSRQPSRVSTLPSSSSCPRSA